MRIFKEIAPLRLHLQALKKSGQSIGLVPTMGALHEGHLSLVAASRQQCDTTVCTLYVNPTQFNNASDLAKYPRTLDADIALLSSAGCDVLFCPDNSEMYERNGIIRFDFGELDKVLEGKYRPGHFSGVATVVSKLFNIAGAHHAFFGQKDYQQFQIISRLVEELKFDLTLHCIPTMREKDGLAMSSRNMRLSSEQRKKALIISKNLAAAKELLRAGTPWTDVHQTTIADFQGDPEVKLEYFELADKNDLTKISGVNPNEGILLVACYVGEVRLIDNMLMNDE